MLESGVDILIGTTGRLIDYAKQNHINLGAIQVVVLDEADRMYDLGFIKDIRWLFRRMPPAAQISDWWWISAAPALNWLPALARKPRRCLACRWAA